MENTCRNTIFRYSTWLTLHLNRAMINMIYTLSIAWLGVASITASFLMWFDEDYVWYHSSLAGLHEETPSVCVWKRSIPFITVHIRSIQSPPKESIHLGPSQVLKSQEGSLLSTMLDKSVYFLLMETVIIWGPRKLRKKGLPQIRKASAWKSKECPWQDWYISCYCMGV